MDRAGNDDKRNQSVDKIAVQKPATVDRKRQSGKIGLLYERSDERSEQTLAKPVTTVPNAAPITMPTAISTTFPLSRNCLNPFIVLSSGPT